MKKAIFPIIAAIIAIFLVGCVTKPTTAAATESTITAKNPAIAPEGSSQYQTIEFALAIASMDKLAQWKVDISASGASAPAKSFSGAAPAPATLTWDGKTDAGQPAPEGSYIATLTTTYTAGIPAGTAKSGAFNVVGPPTGSIETDPAVFSPGPDAQGTLKSLTIKISGASAFSTIATWNLALVDPQGATFISWQGNWPAQDIIWDGRGTGLTLIEMGTAYNLKLTLTDQMGNVADITSTLLTDLSVYDTPGGLRIRVNSIVFKAFTADYTDVPADAAASNMDTLNRLTAIFKQFKEYKIKIEGHAVKIFWNDPKRGDIEQTEVLIPLSLSRAQAIKDAMVAGGVDADRISITGVGADNPVVPNSDLENRWQNRRVDFYLVK